MANHKIEAAIEGSIANPEAAQAVIDAVDSAFNEASIVAALADIATANASDLPTAIALANASKAKINALLAAMRAAGILAS
jgi:hypothetical protein